MEQEIDKWVEANHAAVLYDGDDGDDDYAFCNHILFCNTAVYILPEVKLEQPITARLSRWINYIFIVMWYDHTTWTPHAKNNIGLQHHKYWMFTVNPARDNMMCIELAYIKPRFGCVKLQQHLIELMHSRKYKEN